MKIAQMHIWFREHAQMMGMQNNRAILPEQIDNLINTSTMDVVSEIVNQNVGITSENVIANNGKLATINSLRTLYKVGSKVFQGDKVSAYAEPLDPFTFRTEDLDIDALYYSDFAIRYMESAGGQYPTVKPTSWFPIRIVNDSDLANIQNDAILSPKVENPVMVVYANDEDNTFELYFGKCKGTVAFGIADKLSVGEVRYSYIKKPVTVKYVSNTSENNVDSDLPEALQIPMLKHAVDLYKVAVTGALFATQQQQGNRPTNRNNASSENNS